MKTRILRCYNIRLGPVAQLVEQRIEKKRAPSCRFSLSPQFITVGFLFLVDTVVCSFKVG